MSTVAVVLFPKARKDGLFPIRLRVTHERKVAYRTLFYLRKGHFRSGSVVPSFVGAAAAADFNKQIETAISQTNEIINDYEKNGWTYTAQEVLDIDYADFVARREARGNSILTSTEAPRDTIIYAGMHLAERFRSQENFDSYRRYKAEMDMLKDYLATLGKTDVPIAELPMLIDRYFIFLKKREKYRVKKDSTLKRKVADLMAIIRYAHKEGFIRTVIDITVKLDVIKSKKKKLDNDEIAKLEAYVQSTIQDKYLQQRGQQPLKVNRKHAKSQNGRRQAVETFLIQFYLFGARVGDIIALRNKDIIVKSGEPFRIEYYQQKARRKKEGKKLMSVNIHPNILPIIKKYYNPLDQEGFLLPWVKNFQPEQGKSDAENQHLLRQRIKARTARIDALLKDVIKEIGGFSELFSSHSARHSYAQRAKQKGKSIEFIKDTLGHSTYDITAGYLEDLDSDELNAKMQDVYD